METVRLRMTANRSTKHCEKDRKMKRLIIMLCLAVACWGGEDARGLEVNAADTNGESVDLTFYSDFIHFTATASNSGGGVPAVLNGANIPTVSVTSGSVFTNFQNTYNNGNGDGEISMPDNSKAVVAQYQSSPAASNSRIWYCSTNQSEGVSFDAALPAASGSIVLYAAGWNNQAAGKASLAVNIASGTPENASVTYTAPAINFWGAAFTVNWTGRTVGETLSFQFQNIPQSGGGNSGLLAVVVPEPSAYVLGSLAALVFAGAVRRRRGQRGV